MAKNSSLKEVSPDGREEKDSADVAAEEDPHAGAQISYFKLFTTADRLDKVLMFFASTGAVLSGGECQPKSLRAVKCCTASAQ